MIKIARTVFSALRFRWLRVAVIDPLPGNDEPKLSFMHSGHKV